MLSLEMIMVIMTLKLGIRFCHQLCATGQGRDFVHFMEKESVARKDFLGGRVA